MLLIATSHGVIRCEQRNDDWRSTHRTLTEYKVTAITVRAGIVVAGTTDGVFRSSDGGLTWDEMSGELSIPHVRWLDHPAARPSPLLAGTEPAAIFRFSDEGDHWVECEDVSQLRDRNRWYLPYSPVAGAVRGFAFHGERVYAAVEVGGVLRSDDDGRTWKLVEGSPNTPDTDPGERPAHTLHPDVHSVVVHPKNPDWVYATTGGGLYRSVDGGAMWRLLYRCYCRAVWVDPTDPDHILLGPADGVSRVGRIEETRDGGRTWIPASQGLATPWHDQMVRRFYASEESIVALVNREPPLIAPKSTLRWRRLPFEAGGANALAILEQ